MKIELKAIKYSEFASQETNCYTANLYVDGKKIGTVGNDGHGGCDYFHGDNAAFARTNDWCKANLPKWDHSEHDFGDDEKHDTDLEMHCGALVDAWLLEKDLKKAMNKAILYIKDNSIMCMGFTGVRKITQKHLDYFTKGRPAVTPLNLMPLGEALELYKAHG